MIKTHVERRLGSIVEVRVTEGLLTKSVFLSKESAVVLKQTNIHAQIRLVASGRQYLRYRHRLPWFQGPVSRRLLRVTSAQKA